MKAKTTMKSSGSWRLLIIRAVPAVTILGVASVLLLPLGNAASFVVREEAEDGLSNGNAVVISSTDTSGGQAVRFQPSVMPPIPPPNPAARLFIGDFETGSLNQWPGCQSISHNDPCTGYDNGHYSMKAVSSPKRQGDYAARFEVRDGDYPFCCGERAQVRRNAFETEGKELWYSWSTMAEQLPAAASFQVLFQWHSTIDGSPPLAFFVENKRLTLRIHTNCCGPYDGTRDIWTGPLLEPGQWQDIKIHAKWSQNSNIGFVELWHNGVRQTFSGNPTNGNGTACIGATRCSLRTIHAGDAGNYLIVGYYRDQNINGTAVVYHDGITIASNEAGLIGR